MRNTWPSVLVLSSWRFAALLLCVTSLFVNRTCLASRAVHRLVEQLRRPNGRLGKDTAASVEAVVATLRKEAEQLRAEGESSFEVHYEPMGDGSFVASIVVRSYCFFVIVIDVLLGMHATSL